MSCGFNILATGGSRNAIYFCKKNNRVSTNCLMRILPRAREILRLFRCWWQFYGDSTYLHLIVEMIKFYLILPLLLFTKFVLSQSNDSATIKIKDTFVYDINVEYEAQFPGGDLAWKKYLSKNIDANIPAINGAKNGEYKITIQFTITKDGLTSDIKADTHFGFGMEDEVIKAIKSSPKWDPYIQKGKPISVNRKQSFTFIISGG